MYAYIDESGNTGKNLFDKDQPLFITAAFDITQCDFDSTFQTEIKRITNSIGEKVLHANVMGLTKVESIANELLEILKKCDARFFISIIDKHYLATAKLVDTLFDPYENKAVPWHVYNLRPLRLLLVFKIAAILTEEVAVKFWDSLSEKNEEKAYIGFTKAIADLRNSIEILPDERSKQLIRNAIDWAIKNPKAIYIHLNSKSLRSGNFPNMVAFPNLLRGIDQISQEFQIPVKEIIHDRQNQFEKMLEEWHALLSNADSEVISLPGEEDISIQCVANSKFRISSSEASIGIQVIDVVMWLYKQFNKNISLGNNSIDLLAYVFKNGYKHELSFKEVGMKLSEYFDKLWSEPLTEEGIARATQILKNADENNQQDINES